MRSVHSVAGVVLAGLALWSGVGFAQSSNATATEIARRLVSERSVVSDLTKKLKAKYKVEKTAAKYLLANGESPAVLIALPEFTTPHTLKLFSRCNCFGFSKSILVPSGTFLDAELAPTRPFDETDVVTSKSMGKGAFVSATFRMTEESRRDRYLLVYTRGDLLGKTADKIDVPGLGGLLFGGALPMKRSDFGTLELEITLPKARK